MTLAIVLVIAAALALILILSLSFSKGLQASKGDIVSQLQPIDVEAFRNLVNPSEGDYLRRRLPPAEFRRVQRERLLAMAAYVRLANHNAALLVHLGQGALAVNDARTAEAARELVDNALLLRRNATFAMVKIYAALVWPRSAFAAAPVLLGYEQLSGSAMLLGRLQNPATPVRLSATS